MKRKQRYVLKGDRIGFFWKVYINRRFMTFRKTDTFR